jgi:preprotein translocase subunit SecD
MKNLKRIIRFSIPAIMVIMCLCLAGCEMKSSEATPSAVPSETPPEIGIEAYLYPLKNSNEKISESELEKAKSIIAKRLDNEQIYDRQVTIDYKNNLIKIQIYKKDEALFKKNPLKKFQQLCKTGHLTFREVDESKKDKNGHFLPIGKIVVEGSDVKSATYQANPQTGSPEVMLVFNPAGSEKFSAATASLIERPIGIFMDDKLITAPTVKTQITNGMVSISNISTEQESKDLAAIINSGALPFKFKVVVKT